MASTTFDAKAFGAKNAQDLTSPWVHVFLYGASGSGKTEAAGTFPRPLFIVPYNEQSIVTLRGKNIDYFEVVDMDKTPLNLRTGQGSMMAVIKHIENFYYKDHYNFPYDTIVCDGLSHYSDLIQEQLTNGAQKGMAQNDWGTLSSHYRTVQSRLRRLQVHTVFTALETVESGEDGKVMYGGPMLSGKLADKLPSSCDITGYCEAIPAKDGMVYRVHFRKYRHYDARTRYKRVPSVIQNFQFSKIEHALTPDAPAEEQEDQE